jgi:hypothetical protein
MLYFLDAADLSSVIDSTTSAFKKLKKKSSRKSFAWLGKSYQGTTKSS